MTGLALMLEITFSKTGDKLETNIKKRKNARFSTRENLAFPMVLSGAGNGTRTRDLLITIQLLCQLSYAGT